MGKDECKCWYTEGREVAPTTYYCKHGNHVEYSVGKGCPPHNMIPYDYEGTWGGSVPPPNMKCTKCLLTDRF